LLAGAAVLGTALAVLGRLALAVAAALAAVLGAGVAVLGRLALAVAALRERLGGRGRDRDGGGRRGGGGGGRGGRRRRGEAAGGEGEDGEREQRLVHGSLLGRMVSPGRCLPLELLLVEAVALLQAAAHQADAGVDGGVVVQGPAELAALHPQQAGRVVHLHV